MDDREVPRTAFPPHRAVVLGASNVVRDLATMVQATRQVVQAPLDLLFAIGHGRGYARPCWVLGRWLPPIVECGLWDVLSHRPADRTYALLTDIGNDLLYGATVDQVVQSVEVCLQRLAVGDRRIAIAGLPVETLQSLTPARFSVLRRLLFPSSRLTYDAAMAGAAELNQRVADLALQHGADFARPLSDWYSWDPIHVRRRCRAMAWRAFLSAWRDSGDRDTGAFPLACASWWRWAYLFTRMPQRQRMFGIEQRRDQPVCRLRDGTQLSFF